MNTMDRGLIGIGLQLEKFSLPMSYYFQMECRRWAPTRSCGWFSGLSFVLAIEGMLD
jgi:hypothetical protein